MAKFRRSLIGGVICLWVALEYFPTIGIISPEDCFEFDDFMDEDECLYEECIANSRFSCRNLNCVDMNLKCDGADDCGDNSDEESCRVDGGWSSWNTWSSCTKPCESGSQTRTRSCTQPPPKNGGSTCPGTPTEQRACNTHPCPVDGGWSSWAVWTPCTKTCESGTQRRSRRCTQPRPRHGGKPCPGAAITLRVCNTKSCPVDGGWSNWGGWSSCSKSCGTGNKDRVRSCTRPSPRLGGKPCPGKPKQSDVCNTHSCPVHGGWSVWSSWSSCGKTCGSGVKERTRSCTNPPPSFGGKGCGTHNYESKKCVVKPCPVDGGWAGWSFWSSCSKTCGSGRKERSRTCTQPSPSFGGNSCAGKRQESSMCNSQRCPVDGGWSSWAVWSSCTKTCESGTQTRSRSCTQPRPQHEGKACQGAAFGQRVCNTKYCPVDGGWSYWGRWSSCSKSCGTGNKERFRSCTRPLPRYGGKPCPGKSRESDVCNTRPCPVHGGWSAWSSWSSCGKTCGGGVKERRRSCTNPPPFFGGNGCGIHYYESKESVMTPCPVDGSWAGWSIWSSCSKTCGSGLQQRSRTCTQPSPSFGGNICLGEARESSWCNSQLCPVHGGWSGWSVWSSCSKSCGTGSQERSRTCTQPSPSSGGKTCAGKTQEISWCNSYPCPVHGGWSGWSSWSPCGKTCGGGVRERTRSCTNPPPYFGGKGCGPHHYESKQCAVKKCPVDGGWSAWSNWTECSVTCGAGVVSRERKCDNPPPAAGGKSCLGYSRDVKTCNTTEICMSGVGCYANFPSSLLKDFRNYISWNVPPFSNQMDKIVKRCAHLAKTKRMRFFAVENYGLCCGTQSFSPGNQLKANRCNFGVGLEKHFYVYEITR